jgi:hypothetical protein
MDGAKQIKDVSCMLLTKGEKNKSGGVPSLLKLESVGKRCRKKQPFLYSMLRD